jgi:hydroxypyruvate reductase
MGRRIVARLERALRELHPRASLRAACTRLPRGRRWGVILLGKDAASLAEGVALPDCRGILVAPPDRLPARASRRWTVLPGAHPVPDRSSFEAGDALLRFAADPAFDAFLVGLTGGGSALAEVPLRPFFTRADLAACHRDLLASGLPITAMNAVRKRLSAIKGGRLAAAMGPRPAWTFLISDVPAGHDDAIASGPTLPDAASHRRALAVLAGLPDRAWARKLREAAGAGRLPETLTRRDRVFRNKRHRVLADNAILLDRLARDLKGERLRPRLLLSNADGPAERVLPALWRAFVALKPREALLLGGEFTAALPRRAGRGGRVSHLSLMFLERLLSKGCPFPFGFLGMATDGADGTSPGAGVFLDGPAGTPAEARVALEAHDSGTFFDRHGLLLAPLRDRLNLRDCFILWRAA